MPRPPPRPLCLPELVSNSQKRADFVLANPPKYGPSSSRPSAYTDSSFARVPPSPTSSNDADSHRASGATFASLISPATPTSSRTSLSVHHLSWNGDNANGSAINGGLLSMPGTSSQGKSWNFGKLSLGGGTPFNSQKPRTSWSSAFVNTKSWFGSATPTESVEAIPSVSSQKEIKLSPSMIAASTSTHSMSKRSVSSPYPSTSDTPIPLPTYSVDTTRFPKVGTGLRYYSERNPAPPEARVQIPDPIYSQDQPQSPSPPVQQGANDLDSTYSVSPVGNCIKELPAIPHMTDHVTSDRVALKEAAMLRKGDMCPLSPPPTPPVHAHESNVPRIRVSFGESS